MRTLRSGALFAGVVYLAWRIVATSSGAHPVLFALLLLAEVFGLVRFAVEMAAMGEPRTMLLPDHNGEAESADVVIVVFDHPTSELRAALLSARSLEGAASVTVIDVLDRPDIAETCERFDVARVRGGVDGDLGDLLTEAYLTTGAPYLVIQPADVVVLGDLMHAAAPMFEDPEIGVLVGGVDTANFVGPTDLSGYGVLAMRDALAGRALDDAHALPWWHGLSVARREALWETGGFAPSRRGATLVTGVRLQVGGWRIAQLPVIVGRHLAPTSDHRRVHAWARDLHQRLELLRRSDISWSSARITPMMRLAYVAPIADVAAGVQRLMLLAVLLATAWGVGLPLVAPGLVLAVLFGVQMSLRLAVRLRATQTHGALPLLIRDLLLAPTELAVGWRALRRRPLLTELVDAAPGQRVRRYLIPVVQALSVISLFAGLGGRVDGDGQLARFAVVGASVGVLVATVIAQLVIRRRQSRAEYRAVMSVPVVGSEPEMTAVAMTPFGLDVVSSTPLVSGTSYRLDLTLPGATGASQTVTVATTVRQTSTGSDGSSRSLLRYALSNDQQMDALIDYCAVVHGRQRLRIEADREALHIEVLEDRTHPASMAKVRPATTEASQ